MTPVAGSLTNGITIRTVGEANDLMALVLASATRTQRWISEHTGDPLDLLRQMKFAAVGYHPIDGRPLNLIEQVNQTWTFVVAIAAAQQLLKLHPQTSGMRLAPGAHASLDLDIMSEEPGFIGAETFAAVNPRNNGKLVADITKLAGRHERHRYVFFMSPMFPGNERRQHFERDGIEVWSVDI